MTNEMSSIVQQQETATVSGGGSSSKPVERSDSGKRRRLSECRKVFNRLSGKRASELATSQAEAEAAAAAAVSSSKQHDQQHAKRLLSTGSSVNQSSWSSSVASQSGTADSEQLFMQQASPFAANTTTTTTNTTSSSNKTPPSKFASFGTVKKSFKIQLFIRLAPDNEPLIFDHQPHQSLTALHEQHDFGSSSRHSKHQSLESLTTKNNSTNEPASKMALIRQTSTSTKRRQQLLAMHNQSIKTTKNCQSDDKVTNSEDNLLASSSSATDGVEPKTDAVVELADKRHSMRIEEGDEVATDDDCWTGGYPLERERSSTIAGGCLTDRATNEFLDRQKQQHHFEKLIQQHSLLIPANNNNDHSATLGSRDSTIQRHLHHHRQNHHHHHNSSHHHNHAKREHIYFKRDGQRFGHEFTLKLAVGKSYRCLFKIKPLVPLDSITIQGHNVQFVDCSRNELDRSNYYASLSSSAGNLNEHSAGNSSSVRSSWQNISTSNQQHQQNSNRLSGKRASAGNNKTQPQSKGPAASQQQQHRHSHAHQHRGHLPHALTMSNVSRVGVIAQPNAFLGQRASLAATTTSNQLQQQLMRHIRDQQQSQLMRYFASSHSASSSASSAQHQNDQHMYMFDWSASHFEVNKNKVRTQVETVLEFKNGQTVTLPLQVKFYQSESRQHLEWGSQLHFIDYDCSINNLGDIQLDRVQYY